MTVAAFMHYIPWSTVIFLVLGSLWRSGLVIAVLLQLFHLLSRGVVLGRLPLLGPHDTLLFFSMSVALMGLIASCSPILRGKRWFIAAIGMTATLFLFGALPFKPLNMPLPQILDTFWFELHVVLAFFGYALFTIGAVAAAAYLITNSRLYLDILYKTSLVGWTLFSASMVSGGIWGYYAWGTYWLWTPKELWTSILWLFYAMVLHVRLKGSRWDKAFAWLGIIGVFVMLFTYLGVSMLMKSSHSF
ncbi:MAG: cytochrome c biogenesis protein CcsA [Desulfuromonadaceae bacterium]|nr:cytochrome c biogenesis protein CcsA [Desulfuromonadaceae bacterium]MDD5105807.1 cytochrome c biogenesis protein CcsA [Desulfuromonadaceae bacterium]